MNKGIEMINEAIPSGQRALEFGEPREQALDFPPSAILLECSGILRYGLDVITLVWCNQCNALGSKPAIEWITVVGAIPDKSSGSSRDKGFIEGSLDKGDFMWRSTSRPHGRCASKGCPGYRRAAALSGSKAPELPMIRRWVLFSFGHAKNVARSFHKVQNLFMK